MWNFGLYHINKTIYLNRHIFFYHLKSRNSFFTHMQNHIKDNIDLYVFQYR